MYNSTHPIWYLNFAMLVEFYLWVNIFQYQHVLAELRHQWRCQATTNQNLGNLGPKTGRTIWDPAHMLGSYSAQKGKNKTPWIQINNYSYFYLGITQALFIMQSVCNQPKMAPFYFPRELLKLQAGLKLAYFGRVKQLFSCYSYLWCVFA